MPSIAEVTGRNQHRNRWRLVVGFGLVLLGGFLVGLGAWSTIGGGPLRTGAPTTGLVVLIGLFLVATRIPMGEREQTLVATGATIGVASLLLFWGLVPRGTPASLSAGSIVAVAGYLVGLSVKMAALLAGITSRPSSRAPARRTTDPSISVSWTRSASDQPGDWAADGGSSDDHHAGPAEDD